MFERKKIAKFVQSTQFSAAINSMVERKKIGNLIKDEKCLHTPKTT